MVLCQDLVQNKMRNSAAVTEIEKFGKEKYGELSGYAQQYLFYYGKTLNIGK